MSTEKIPSDIVYENGLNIRVRGTSDSSSRSVELDVAHSDTGNVLDISRFTATQFHYSELSQVMLCGRVLRCETSPVALDSMQLAMDIGQHALEGADAWGQYLQHVGAGTSVSKRLKLYYQELFDETDPTALFLGMSILGGTATYALYRRMETVGDDAYRHVIGQMINRKKREMQLLRDHLQHAVQDMTSEEEEQLANTAGQYQDAALGFMEAHREQFQGDGIEPDSMISAVAEATQTFYQSISLESVEKLAEQSEQGTAPLSHYLRQ